MVSEIPVTVRKLEQEIGVPSGFFRGLSQADDWSFIVKAHAFIEGALSHVLVHATGREDLRPIFSALETANSSTGKLAFAEALELVDKADRRFLRAFSELRNLLVHDVTQVNFNLDEYVSNLDQQKLQAFAKAFSLVTNGQDFEFEGQKVSIVDTARQFPKTSIWYSLMMFSTKIYLRKDAAQFASYVELFKKESVRELLRKKAG